MGTLGGVEVLGGDVIPLFGVICPTLLVVWGIMKLSYEPNQVANEQWKKGKLIIWDYIGLGIMQYAYGFCWPDTFFANLYWCSYISTWATNKKLLVGWFVYVIRFILASYIDVISSQATWVILGDRLIPEQLLWVDRGGSLRNPPKV